MIAAHLSADDIRRDTKQVGITWVKRDSQTSGLNTHRQQGTVVSVDAHFLFRHLQNSHILLAWLFPVACEVGWLVCASVCAHSNSPAKPTFKVHKSVMLWYRTLLAIGIAFSYSDQVYVTWSLVTFFGDPVVPGTL